MFRKLKYTFIGRPLKSLTDGEGGLLGKMQALAMLSSDALSSIAYGPEQVILVLVSLSPLAIWWSLPIGIFVLLLLASLTISYRQIIHAYPQGGGAYMVTQENLSPELGLIAGGSLLVDYMLTVAVSVASGADAITCPPSLQSSYLYFPSLPAHALEFKRIKRICQLSDDSRLPLYLQYRLSLALWVLSTIYRFPKLSGDFNHWANRSESFHRSPIESLYQWLCLSDRG